MIMQKIIDLLAQNKQIFITGVAIIIGVVALMAIIGWWIFPIFLLIGYHIALKQLTKRLKNDVWAGWYFNFITWQAARAMMAIGAGVGFAVILKIAFVVLIFLTPLSIDPMNSLVTVMISVAVSFMAWSTDVEEPNESDKEQILTVPGTKMAAYMFWFGMSLEIYFQTSLYRGYRRFGFSRSEKVMLPFTDEQGFLNMGEVPFKVWDHPMAKAGTEERVRITRPAKNNADVAAELTLILAPVRPKLMLDSDDAALDLGERSRAEWQELVSQLVDTDIPALQSVLAKLLIGTPMVTCFIARGVAGYKAGSMLRDGGGSPMFELVRDNEPTTAKAIARLFKRINSGEADSDMLKKVVSQKKNGVVESRFYTVVVSNPIDEVLGKIGYKVERAMITNVKLSQKVKDAAEEASAEQDQRISQLQSMETILAVRQGLMPGLKEMQNPQFAELATIIAAAQDDAHGNIRVVWTPGGNSLTSAAVVGADQLRGK